MSYYKTIDDLPVYNYWKVIESGNLSFIEIEGKNSNEDLFKAWQNIEVEVIRELMKDAEYLVGIKKSTDLALSMIKATVKDDAFARHTVKVHLLEREGTDKKADFYELLSVMEQRVKMPIDEKKMSVRKYLTHIRILKRNG